MIALFGVKPLNLEKLINNIIDIIQNSKFGDFFYPFPKLEIHATIIGLEIIYNLKRCINANIWYDLKQKKEMNFEKLIQIFKEYFPINIRFGGINKTYNRFKSWGDNPYKRSFQLLCPAGDFTLIGWPFQNGNYDNKILWNLRNDLEYYCNIRHKYSKYNDNDFFIRIGRIKDDYCNEIIEYKNLQNDINKLENKIREYLYKNPEEINVTLDDVHIAEYFEKSFQIDIISYIRFLDDTVNSKYLENFVLKSLHNRNINVT